MKMALIELTMEEILRVQRCTHKPVNLLMSWWTIWYLSSNYPPFFLFLTNPNPILFRLNDTSALHLKKGAEMNENQGF